MTLNISPYDINNAMTSYLGTNWSYTSIREINKDDAPAIPYIEVYTKPGQTVDIEIQGAATRPGVWIINIFTKKGVGVQQGFSYGKKLEEMFWNAQISGVYCGKPYTQYIGIDAALNACHHQVIIPFDIITES